ncbi:hypothetical protein BGZ75_002995 [Mortierella antarctica]|nr:hypothetical protein BGZ75_002995 [Mortierella antarctica]
MTNSSKASPPTTTSSGKASVNADDDHSSISSQHLRKRDKIRNFFRSPKSEETVSTQASLQNNILATCAEDGVPLDNVDSPLTSEKTQLRKKARSDIFSENVNRPAASIKVPEKLGTRIQNTPQLAL